MAKLTVTRFFGRFQNVEKGAVLNSDEWSAYSGLRALGYQHKTVRPTAARTRLKASGRTSSAACAAGNAPMSAKHMQK
jgi:hypothetical protein